MSVPNVSNCHHFIIVPSDIDYSETGIVYKEAWDAKECDLTCTLDKIGEYRAFSTVKMLEAEAYAKYPSLEWYLTSLINPPATTKQPVRFALGLQDEAIGIATEHCLSENERVLLLLDESYFPGELLDMITLTEQLTLAFLNYGYINNLRQIRKWQILLDRRNHILGVEFAFDTEEERRQRAKAFERAVAPNYDGLLEQ